MKTRIISFGNHKGGVGKTTTTASVGSILASKGYKVLVVDLDAQANLTVSLLIAMAEMELTAAISREKILAELLEPVKEKYEFILIDCPPSLGLLTLNAFTASNEIIIPLVAEVLPFKGLTMINDFINQVQHRLNGAAHVTGILITRWESTKLTREIEERLRKQLGSLVFTTKIRKNITVAQAPLESKNIVEFDPKCNGALDYRAFTEELLARFGLS